MYVRFICRAAVAAIVILASANEAAPQSARRNAEVEQLAAEAIGHLFGTSRAEWRLRYPAAAWRAYRGSPDDIRATSTIGPDGRWCALATTTASGIEREVVFYALRDERPLDCRIEETRFAIDATDVTTDQYDALIATLDRRFGSRMSQPREWHIAAQQYRLGGFWGRRPGRWKDPECWMTDTGFVFLYRDEGRIEVLARSRTLYAALAEPPTSATLTRFGYSRLQWELINAVRSRLPEAAALIVPYESFADQDAVQHAALGLLEALKKARGSKDAPMLALATAQVLSRLRIEGPSPIAGRPTIAPLLDYGVGFAESPYDDDIWYYNGRLTDQIVSRYPHSFWATLAMVDRIDGGWVRECTPSFNDVIREARRFLREHPHSEFASRLTYDVAQAYETAWSVSIAPEEEEAPDTPQPRGDESSRRRAIDWYERFLAVTPSAAEAPEVRHRLIQLKLGVDTGQRRFACEYA